MSAETPEKKPATFPKRMHLLKTPEFQRVFQQGQRHVGRIMIVFRRPNRDGFPRIGLVVSRKAGKSHDRNRIKRLLREAFRLQQERLPDSDLVVIPRPGFLGKPYDVVASELVYLATRPSRPPKRRDDQNEGPPPPKKPRAGKPLAREAQP
ncbi:MAG: ribonuclease P protein component [Planctomycetota bacterium]